MDALFTWLFTHYKYLALIIFAAGIASFITFKLIKVYYNHFKPIERDVCKLKDDHKSLQDNILEIISSLKVIKTYLIIKDKDAINAFTQSKSPMSLTPKGISFLEECGGKKLIDDNSTFFIKELENANSHTALDVENNAKEVLLKNIDSIKFNEIKTFLYNHPVYEKEEISMSIIITIISIYLRDKYLKIHTEINTDSNKNIELD